MEQWEKDYLEEISRRNKNASENITASQKEYINECWQEITRPNGSKWYVPNQEAIRKKQRKANRKALLSAGFRKAVKMLLWATIFCCVLLRFANSVPKATLSNLLDNARSLVAEWEFEGFSSSFSEIGAKGQEGETADDKIIYMLEEGSGLYHSCWGIAEIETFIIKSVRESFIDNFVITYEVKGVVNDGSFLHLSLNCYDKEGYLLDSVTVFEKISEGERFKITGESYIPLETSKIVVAAAE